MDERPLVEGYIANFGISLDVLSFCVLDDFFCFSKKLGFWVFSVHPTVVSVLLSASVERFYVSRMRDFLLLLLVLMVLVVVLFLPKTTTTTTTITTTSATTITTSFITSFTKKQTLKYGTPGDGGGSGIGWVVMVMVVAVMEDY